MTERVPIKFQWGGSAMPAGSLLKLNGRVVGELTEDLKRYQAGSPLTMAKALVDMNTVDKSGDNYSVPPGVSFLIVKP